MRRKNEHHIEGADRVVKDIRRQTRRRYSAEDKIRIVLAGLRGDDSIAELCRQEGIAQRQYYSWSKEFMEAGKKRLAGDTEREANTGEVKELRREARDLKEVVADAIGRQTSEAPSRCKLWNYAFLKKASLCPYGDASIT